MPDSERLFNALVAEVHRAGEVEHARFQASRGPYYGFNGTYCYLVTENKLWRARSTVTQLVGGVPEISDWPLQSCRWGAREGKKALLATPDFQHHLAFETEALADEAVASLDRGV